MKRVYLDVCCLNRPFDDQSQDRVHMEGEAVLLVAKYIENGQLLSVSSTVVDFEIGRTRDTEKCEKVTLLASKAKEKITATNQEIVRAQQLEAKGFDPLDALHIACAERGKVDILLTTDDKFVKQAHKHERLLQVEVENPLSWVEEMLK